MCRRVCSKSIILLGLAGYEMIITVSALRASLVIYVNNSLHLAAKICSDICPRTLSVPGSEQFSESEARGKL